MTPPDDFLLLSPPTHLPRCIFFDTSVCDCGLGFLCSLTFLTTEFENKAAEPDGLMSVDTLLAVISPPVSNQRNGKLPRKKNQQTKQWPIQRFGPFSLTVSRASRVTSDAALARAAQ
ncbi:hypothetical protein EYF80_009400 [Liparis tanakae]|uniref:Uncharacterized protein n=1 Tax=Liparis tanakae TaxID=230148 RepID=A0A4Z2IRA0_9TELE|nr:hypothetical protein EYF80_009400 [Liparis tanakae]